MCKCLIDLQEKSIIPNLYKNRDKFAKMLKKQEKEYEDL